jgi:uncharacterized ion transporter superfamily protein YfcC
VVTARSFRHGRSSVLGNLLADLERLHHSAPLSRFPEPPLTKTGAIDAGIGWLLTALKGREIWMIPILMTAFAAGGTSYGMAEESLAFYAIVLPVFIRAGYDAVTGVAVIMLGAGIGTLGSTFNAFATVVGSNAAGVPFTDGLLLRVLILVLCVLRRASCS